MIAVVWSYILQLKTLDVQVPNHDKAQEQNQLFSIIWTWLTLFNENISNHFEGNKGFQRAVKKDKEQNYSAAPTTFPFLQFTALAFQSPTTSNTSFRLSIKSNWYHSVIDCIIGIYCLSYIISDHDGLFPKWYDLTENIQFQAILIL